LFFSCCLSSSPVIFVPCHMVVSLLSGRSRHTFHASTDRGLDLIFRYVIGRAWSSVPRGWLFPWLTAR
jgi:hypothetical protein